MKSSNKILGKNSTMKKIQQWKFDNEKCRQWKFDNEKIQQWKFNNENLTMKIWQWKVDNENGNNENLTMKIPTMKIWQWKCNNENANNEKPTMKWEQWKVQQWKWSQPTVVLRSIFFIKVHKEKKAIYAFLIKEGLMINKNENTTNLKIIGKIANDTIFTFSKEFSTQWVVFITNTSTVFTANHIHIRIFSIFPYISWTNKFHEL